MVTWESLARAPLSCLNIHLKLAKCRQNLLAPNCDPLHCCTVYGYTGKPSTTESQGIERKKEGGYNIQGWDQALCRVG